MAYKPCRLFNAKAILQKEYLWYYLTHSWEEKEVYTFPKPESERNSATRLQNRLLRSPQSITLTINPRGHPRQFLKLFNLLRTNNQ